jgi:REP element-mobilizing transposase RayT
MSSKIEIHVHVVWGTWKRRAIISPEVEPEIYRVIGSKCVELRCLPLAIGGTADHVHLLARLHPSIPVARLVAEVKGSSSHAVTHLLARGSRFRWQRGYGAFSVSPNDVPAVERYVREQRNHHALRAIEPGLEPDEQPLP